MRTRSLSCATLAVALATLAPAPAAGMGTSWGGANAAPIVDSLSVAATPVPATAATGISCAAHDTDGTVQELRITVDGGALPNGTTTDVMTIAAGAAVSGSIAWQTPGPGTYAITCAATDSGGTATASTLSVDVIASDNPIVDAFTAPSTPIYPGKAVTLTVTAHDPRGSALTYQWAADAGSIVPNGATGVWTAPATPGTYGVTVVAQNATGGAASSTVAVGVVLASYAGELASRFSAPQRMTVAPGGDVYVVDGQNGDVWALTPLGEAKAVFQVTERAVAVAASPQGLLASTAAGNLWLINPASGHLLRSTKLGAMPNAMAYEPTRGLLWLAERQLGRVRAVRSDGTTAFSMTSAGGTQLSTPSGIAVDAANGLVWVTLSSNEDGPLAHAFTRDGAYVRSAVTFGRQAGQVTRSGGVAVDPQGRLYVSDMFQGVVQVLSATGQPVSTLGTFGTGKGELQQPSDLAVLANGDVAVLNLAAGRLDRYGAGAPLPTCAVGGLPDSDCDGMPDAWEILHGLNPNWAGDALLDADGDGLTNLQEFQLGTDPRKRDTDGDAVSDGDEVAAGMNPLDPNDGRPVLVVGGTVQSDPGLVELSASIRWTSACTFSWTQRLGPRVDLAGANTLAPSFIGRVAARYQFVGVASCGAARSAPTTLDVVVRNAPPVPAPGRPVVVYPGQHVLLDARASTDANGDALTFSWDQVLGPPLAMATPGPVLPLAPREPGLFAFELSATDPGRATSTADIPVLVVAPGAEPPTPLVQTPVVATTGTAVALDATQSVIPIASASYAWSQVEGPAVPLAGGATAQPSFTPPRAGRYAFELSLSAGELSAPRARAEVYASDTGTLPQALVAAARLDAAVGAPVRLDGGGSAGTGLTWSWRQVAGPAAGLTCRDCSVATVVPFQTGVHLFELSVTDDGGAVSLPARVRVDATAPSQAIPVAVAAGPASASVGLPVRLDGTGSRDPGGHPLKFRWTQVGGPWAPLDDATASAPRFYPQHAGSYAFELEVRAGNVASAPASVTVVVGAGGQP